MSGTWVGRLFVVGALAAGALALPAAAHAQATPPDRWHPADSLEVFVGLDGAKQPQDLGINANMGPRLSVNWGAPVAGRSGLGAQVGVGVNLSDAAVHVLDQIEGTSRRTQTFLTAGLFQRNGRLAWGVGVDALWEHYYDDFHASQVRSRLDYAVTPATSVGIAVRAGAGGADGFMAGTPVRVSPIGQTTFVFTRTWESRARTSAWVGVAGGHHNVVWVFPDNSFSGKVAVYGAELLVPLSDRVALTGATNLITPTATGTVDAYLGLVFTPRGGWLRGALRPFHPILPVANNPEFALDLRR